MQPLPPSPSRPIQSSTVRWWKMLLLVLIQFDISYYGSSEAHTKVALEIDWDRNHFFRSTVSLSSHVGYCFCFLSFTCEDFQINRGRGRVRANSGSHMRKGFISFQWTKKKKESILNICSFLLHWCKSAGLLCRDLNEYSGKKCRVCMKTVVPLRCVITSLFLWSCMMINAIINDKWWI